MPRRSASLRPAAVSRTMRMAPPIGLVIELRSSAGWKRRTTRPFNSARLAAISRAAPTSIAMWPSCPHA